MKPMEARRNELLTMVATVAAEQARAFGLPQDQAEQIGAAVADALAEFWGGQTLYFAHDASYRLSKRDREVVQAHQTGASISSLARTYRMSEQGIRKLLQRAPMRDPNLDQADLFTSQD